MDRAVPRIVRFADSRSCVFMSCIFCSASSWTCFSLTVLFETLWRLSVPLHRPEPELGSRPDQRVDQPVLRDRQVLMMLAGGATDETIARQLGVSSRTVERRVRALLDRLGAETRFQAGVQAARRGWL